MVINLLAGGGVGFALGVVSVYYGKVLPARTQVRALNHSVEMDELNHLESSLNRESDRLSRLVALFAKEPALPEDIGGSDGVTQMVEYQKVRTRAARELPDLVHRVNETRAELVSLRQRAFATHEAPAKTDVESLSSRLFGVEREVASIVEAFGAAPRIFIRHISDEPDDEDVREGDLVLLYGSTDDPPTY